MNRTLSRRVFVGSVAAGIPLVVGASRGSFAQSADNQSHIHAAHDGTPDAMLDHATRQLAAIVTRVQRRGATAEDARLAAAHLGSLALYAQQAGFDAPAKQAVRDLVRSKGRDAVLFLDIDRARARSRLKTYGVDADERWFDLSLADYNTRVAALNGLQNGELTSRIAHIASTFERVAAEFDRRGGLRAGLRLAQNLDEDWRRGFCEQLSREISRLEAEIAIVCGLGFFFPPMEPVCAMMTISVGIQLGIYAAYC